MRAVVVAGEKAVCSFSAPGFVVDHLIMRVGVKGDGEFVDEHVWNERARAGCGRGLGWVKP